MQQCPSAETDAEGGRGRERRKPLCKTETSVEIHEGGDPHAEAKQRKALRRPRERTIPKQAETTTCSRMSRRIKIVKCVG